MHIDISWDQFVLGGTRDWLIFTGVECTLLLTFLLSYFVFVVCNKECGCGSGLEGLFFMLQVWLKLRKLLGKVADLLYLSYFLAYACGSLYFVWFAIFVNDVAPVLRLIAFIEQVSIQLVYHRGKQIT